LDTSKAPPAYNVTAPASVSEGTTITFTISTIGVPNGSVIPYTISGSAGSLDFDIGGTGNIDSGNVTIIADNQLVPLGSATVTFNVKNDILTEGTENITLTIPVSTLPIQLQPDPLVNASATVSIIDTSVATVQLTSNNAFVIKYSSPDPAAYTFTTSTTADQGDLIHILFANNVANATTNRVTSLSSNKGLLTEQFDIGNTTSDCHLALYTKIADGGENTFIFNHDGVGIPHNIAWISFIKGVDQTSPIDVLGSGITFAGAKPNRISIPSIITTTDGCLVFAAAVCREGLTTYTSLSGTDWPSVYTDQQRINQDTYITTAYVTKTQTIAGNTNNVSFTYGTGNRGQAAVQWAIRPA
jgi:hypothetical protein